MRLNFKILFMVLFCPLLFFNSSFAQDGQTIKEYLQQVLPSQEGRKIVLDETTGLLTVTDTPSNHKLIMKLIEVWDVGPQQVRIEARFVEIEEKALHEVGVEWLAEKTGDYIYYGEGPLRSAARSASNTPAEQPANYQNIEPGSSVVGEYNYSTSRAIPPWSGSEMGAPQEFGGLGLWVGDTNVDGTKLFAYLKALEGQDKANLLSAPTITTLSGQMANIELANVIPYACGYEQTDTGTGAYGYYETYEIEEKKTGIFLEVTPTVSRGQKMITLELHPSVSEISYQVAITNSSEFPSYLGWPVVETRSTQTSVIVRSGQTIAIGGLIRDDESTTKRKVPIIGNIPLLGNLFKWEHTSRTKRNLVIFLTATIITPEGEEIK